jgi:hypothetical protein
MEVSRVWSWRCVVKDTGGVGRGGVDRLGSEWRTGGERREGAVLKNNPGGTRRGG